MTELDQILQDKIIAIVRGIPSDKIYQTALALADGGITCLEVTFDHSSPEGIPNTLRSLEILRDIPGILPGAGTVLSLEEVDLAFHAGAKYIISPDTVPTVIARTKALSMISIPGAFTPTEATTAYHAGADIVKLFPAGLLGPSYFKAIRGPLPHIPFAAVGGIDEANLGSFYTAGVQCFGIGGKLVDSAAIADGNWAKITAKAAAIRHALTQAEGRA